MSKYPEYIVFSKPYALRSQDQKPMRAFARLGFSLGLAKCIAHRVKEDNISGYSQHLSNQAHSTRYTAHNTAPFEQADHRDPHAQ